MSLRRKHNSQLYSAPGGFSSRSVGAYSFTRISNSIPITPVNFDKSLLTPLNIDVDPTVQDVRNKEKEQIKNLNNRFASYIDKVRNLEQQNKVLETKWKLLNKQNAPSSDTEPMLKSFIATLEKQLELINQDKARLERECMFMHEQVDDYKTKYEEELNRRNNAENEFVMLKKDVDVEYLSKVDMVSCFSALRDEVEFLKHVYDMELHEIRESLKDTSVVLLMDNSRALNLDQIVADVKAQYEDIAARSREDVEKWHKNKYDQMVVEAQQYSSELHSSKAEISELKQMICHLQCEIESTNAQCDIAVSNTAEMEKQGEQAILDAKNRIKDLEQALLKAKKDMAKQLREYQELMNVKLALDIEISTYRKLLEGEEERVGQNSVFSVQTVPINAVPHDTLQRRRAGPILIKTVETQDRLSYS